MADAVVTPPLPVGTRLLHIGPHKTGTTALQSAFHLARDSMAEQGVHYVGQTRHAVRAVTAVTWRRSMIGERPPSFELWHDLADEFRTTEADRVVLSSEFFADTRDEDVPTVMDDLGRDDVHIVVTLRPLARILASQWQQYVQNGLRSSYESWLQTMFDRPPYSPPTPSFWRRHHHDALIERWIPQVGPQNVTVVVLDEDDRQMVMRTFEQLLALHPGTLVPEVDRQNRSLTYSEAEMLRAFNNYFRANGWPDAVYARCVRGGAVKEIKRRDPGGGEQGAATPAWALERAVEIGATAASNIAGFGVRVIGDLASLGDPALAGPALPAPTTLVVPEAAAHAVAGAIIGSGVIDPPPLVKNRPTAQIASRELISIVARRAGRRIGVGRNRPRV